MEPQEEPTIHVPSSNADIDKLTLELLVNKSKLQNYLAKSNPNEYKQMMERQQLYLKHKRRIETFTEQLLQQHTRSNQPMLVSKDIQSVFDAFIDKCIYYFEKLTDIETEDSHTYYENSDDDNTDDVMFENCVEEQFRPPNKPTKSKQYLFPNGTLDMFVRRK
jgi:hypothetical protein